MALVNDYLDFTQKWKREYGEKTLVLMQVGSFFEVYALINVETGEMTGSNISEFSSINDMVISKKNVCVGKQQVVMAGFGLAQLEKYAKKLQDHGYTIVVYTQETDGKAIKRKVSEIISPGTYFMQDGNDILSNNTLCIWLHKSNKTKYASAEMTVGISSIDIFTGKTSLFQYVIKYEKGPATYDELERYIAIYKPTECLLVGNISQLMLKEVVGFIGLECKVLHLISLCEEQAQAQANPNSKKDETLLNNNALRAEKQIYQQEVFKKFYPTLGGEMLADHFPSHFIASQAFCLLLDFIYQHSPNLVRRLAPPLFENHTDKLILANHSLRQLNILDDTRHTGKLRSVSSFLNNCVTSMGKRHFTYNLHNPTTNVKTLQESYEITEHLLHAEDTWEIFRKQFTGLKDLEKLMRKIALHKVAPKDFAFLVQDLQCIAKVALDASGDSKLNAYLCANDLLNASLIEERCNALILMLQSVFCLEKCAQIGEVSCDSLAGIEPELLGFLLPGTAGDVDMHLKNSLDSREKLEAIRLYFSNLVSSLEKGKASLETGRAKTDFIKIHETPKSDAVLLGTSRRVELLKGQLLKKKPATTDITYYSAYSQQKETFALSLSDLEFTTAGSNKKDLLITNTQIKNIASDIQKSKDQLIQEIVLWYKGFLETFLTYEEDMQQIIQYVCELDLLQAKCYLAHKYNYCKPEIDTASQVSKKAYLNFTGLRHPLIEHLQTNELYVTNDLLIGQAQQAAQMQAQQTAQMQAQQTQAQQTQSQQHGMLLYGTNAVGKTSFIKSVGIAVIMAQAGLYVPCSSFTYYPYSSLFTRILGNDNIFKGLSTFAVEMTELRTILTLTDENSLVLGDELCSGTESDSALSIFTAGLEVLHAKKCTFLFATHFHEIVNYIEIQNLPHLKMMHMEVKYNAETGLLIYDRKLKNGPGDSMYGLEVCKSLNLPSDFLERAHTIRMKYNPETKNILSTTSSHFNTKKIKSNCEICGKISSEIHHLQHQQLANKKNSYIDTFHKNHPANLVALCEECHQKIHKTDAQHKIVKTILGYKMVEI
jgi:DNA mismatch repair protein MutS